MNHSELIMAQLDRDRPRWATEWADAEDLRDLVLERNSPESIRARIANRLFHPIINAALAAGLVEIAPAGPQLSGSRS